MSLLNMNKAKKVLDVTNNSLYKRMIKTDANIASDLTINPSVSNTYNSIELPKEIARLILQSRDQTIENELSSELFIYMLCLVVFFHIVIGHFGYHYFVFGFSLIGALIYFIYFCIKSYYYQKLSYRSELNDFAFNYLQNLFELSNNRKLWNVRSCANNFTINYCQKTVFSSWVKVSGESCTLKTAILAYAIIKGSTLALYIPIETNSFFNLNRLKQKKNKKLTELNQINPSDLPNIFNMEEEILFSHEILINFHKCPIHLKKVEGSIGTKRIWTRRQPIVIKFLNNKPNFNPSQTLNSPGNVINNPLVSDSTNEDTATAKTNSDSSSRSICNRIRLTNKEIIAIILNEGEQFDWTLRNERDTFNNCFTSDDLRNLKICSGGFVNLFLPNAPSKELWFKRLLNNSERRSAQQQNVNLFQQSQTKIEKSSFNKVGFSSISSFNAASTSMQNISGLNMNESTNDGTQISNISSSPIQSNNRQLNIGTSEPSSSNENKSNSNTNTTSSTSEFDQKFKFESYLNNLIDYNKIDPTLGLFGSNILDKSFTCINFLLGRIFWDLQKNEDVNRWFKKKIQTKFDNLNIPPFIKNLVIEQLEVGNTFPLFKHMEFPSIDDRNGVWIETLIDYSGGFNFTVDAQLNVELYDMALEKIGSTPNRITMSDLNQSLDLDRKDSNSVVGSPSDTTSVSSSTGSNNLPRASMDNNEFLDSGAGKKFVDMVGWFTSSKIVKKVASTDIGQRAIKAAREKLDGAHVNVSVNIKSIKGSLIIYISAPPSNRIWFSFKTNPVTEIVVLPKIGSHSIHMNVLTNWIEHKIKNEIEKSFVLPMMEDLEIPIMANIFNDDIIL